MATVYEIIQGIGQAAANAYDGAHDDSLAADGKARKVGLAREDGHFINDRRVMDGFKVRLSGPNLILTYHSETKLKDVHDSNRFESDCEQHLADIVKYLKKEYKKVTGNTLTLTMDQKPDIKVEYMSNIRCWVIATCSYKIGGLTDVGEVGQASEDRLDQAVKDWLSLGKNNRLV